MHFRYPEIKATEEKALQLETLPLAVAFISGYMYNETGWNPKKHTVYRVVTRTVLAKDLDNLIYVKRSMK